jgi:hypothetical protein
MEDNIQDIFVKPTEESCCLCGSKVMSKITFKYEDGFARGMYFCAKCLMNLQKNIDKVIEIYQESKKGEQYRTNTN